MTSAVTTSELTSFISSRQFVEDLIITCSLGGKVSSLRRGADGVYSTDALWTFETTKVKKVNSMRAMAINEDREVRVVVGGIQTNSKGAFEVWRVARESP